MFEEEPTASSIEAGEAQERSKKIEELKAEAAKLGNERAGATPERQKEIDQEQAKISAELKELGGN